MRVGARSGVRADPEQREVAERRLSRPAGEQREGEADDGVGQDEHERVGPLLAPEAGEVGQGQSGQREEPPPVAAHVAREVQAAKALGQRWTRVLDHQLVVSPARRRRQLATPHEDGGQHDCEHGEVGGAAAREVPDRGLLGHADADAGHEGGGQVGHAADERGGQAPQEQAGPEVADVEHTLHRRRVQEIFTIALKKQRSSAKVWSKTQTLPR